MLEFAVFNTGHRVQKERFSIKGGKSETVEFPASCVLIKHPEIGYILFDTGYSTAFYKAAVKFPYSIYGKITPVYEIKSVKKQLQKLDIEATEIRYIIISHFHADHISGLKDFPCATFLCHKKAYLKVKGKKGFSALRYGFLPDLLPVDFEDRLGFIENKKMFNLPPFYEGYDIFGDNSIIAIELSGHFEGQIGILFNNLFFTADACRNRRAYLKNAAPSDFILNVSGNRKQYKKTLKNLYDFHKNYPEIKMIPSHCSDTLKRSFNV